MTDIKVFKSNQVGGNVTMITTDQTKIVIDYGEDLPGTEVTEEFSIDWENENVEAVFFTHYHLDHIGRFIEIPENIPIYMSFISHEILSNYYKRRRNSKALERLDQNIILLSEKETVKVKDISVTPYRVDHSAFYSLMFLIETPSKTILHTGDYRDQGRSGQRLIDGKLVPAIVDTIKNDVKKGINRTIDVLITEGTMVGTRSDLPKYTEKQMTDDLYRIFGNNKYVFVIISSTNMDSLDSFFEAASERGMGFYANEYILDMMGVYKYDWFSRAESATDVRHFYHMEGYPLLKKNVSKYVSEKYKRAFTGQRNHMREDGFVAVISEKDEKIFEEFSDLDPMLIYSMWPGYIDEEIGKGAFNAELAKFCKKHNAVNIHVGGHAYPDLIASVIEATAPMESIIPIHTDNPEGFLDLPISEKYKRKVKVMNQKSDQDLQRLYDLNELAAQYYRKRLKDRFGQEGRDLLKVWGITEETIDDYNLGYSGKCKDSLVKHLRKLGYTDGEIVIAGLANNREGTKITDRFINRIMFPIRDNENRVVGFAGRAVGDAKPRYLISPSSPIFDKDKTLFGMDVARNQDSDYLIICEGYLETLILHQSGIGASVAPCCLGGISPEHAKIIKEFSRKAIVCFDNDSFGLKSSIISQDRLENEGCKTVRIDVSPYRDLVDYIWGEGAEIFKKRVAEAFQNL